MALYVFGMFIFNLIVFGVSRLFGSLGNIVFIVSVSYSVFYGFKVYGQEKAKKERIHDNKENLTVDKVFEFQFVDGLPIPQNANVEIYVNKNQFKIYNVVADKWFNLENDRILSVEWIKSSTPATVNKGAVGRGIVGGILGGTAGAVIGSASANKTIINESFYIVLAYKMQDETISIIQFSVDIHCGYVVDEFISIVKKYAVNASKEVNL